MKYDYRASVLKCMEMAEDVAVVESGHKPQSGDVVAVRITEARGNYGELDLKGGQLVELEEGDIVLGALGKRAGVKGYIGGVPARMSRGEELHFLGSGGIFGVYESATKGLGKPYRGEFLGYVSQEGEILNTKDYGIPHADELEEGVRILAVVSTRMDAGKTTLATRLIQHLSGAGLDVGSVKLTGSARERDRLRMREAGSKVSLDFADAGLPSTVEDPEEVIGAAKGIINRAWNSEDLDVLVAEFGAGVISKYGVYDVLKDLDVRKSVVSVCAVAIDVVGAYGLKKILSDVDYELDIISGPITDTTAGVEKVEDTVGVPALNAFREEEMVEAVEIVRGKLESFL